MTTWIRDDRGNRASVEAFGSEAAAQAALDSLEWCSGCTNCQHCLCCTDCSSCTRCYDCDSCYNCNYCSRCVKCHGCSNCGSCTRCTACSDCTLSADCSGCSNCAICFECLHGNGYAQKHPASDGRTPDSRYETPIIENIHQKVYAAASASDALDMRTWHRDGFCGTTHCRAGWVTSLAGDAGRVMEQSWGCVSHAAWLIYKASDPDIAGRPNFYDTSEAALADMKRLAEQEAAKADLKNV